MAGSRIKGITVEIDGDTTLFISTFLRKLQIDFAA